MRIYSILKKWVKGDLGILLLYLCENIVIDGLVEVYMKGVCSLGDYLVR